MPSTAIDRRALLWGAAALGLVSAPWPARASAGLLLATARLPDRRFALVGIEAGGTVRFTTPLPERGHQPVLARGRGEVVVMARRPGRFLMVAAIADGSVRRLLSAPEGRHFYGHATFDAAERLLYTSENDYDGERGVIGVWDAAADYARVGEVPSHGIGPHDLLLAGDGRSLVIANGGILTHPDSGRAKLNLASMNPSLVVVDPATGETLRRTVLPAELHKLGIRHLSVGPDGTVAFGMQYEGPADDPVPLAGVWRPDGEVQLLTQDGAGPAATRNYCGDVTLDATGRYLAASFPRGGRIGVWDLAVGRPVGLVEAEDACGLASEAGTARLWVSDGFGRIGSLDPAASLARSSVTPMPGLAFDNHLVRL